MENASRAIYIAAGVIIGIMIIGVFVYLFRAGGDFGSSYEQKQIEEQLRLFNSKFENFSRENNTISDMISVTNLAIDNNQKNSYDNQKSVVITFKIGTREFYIKTEDKMERNYVFIKGTPKKIYIYDLMEKTRKSIRAKYNFDLLNKLGEDETLLIVDKNMNYKYYFKCTEMKYRESNGRVEKMSFEFVKNTKYTP